MSTGIKIPLAEATARAEKFRAMFGGTYDFWGVAGSVRRRTTECGDIEHVAISAIGQCAAESLFGELRAENLVWRRMDDLIAGGTLAKHIYGASGFRYGNLYRGVEFEGMLHEIFLATPENLGSVLAIRTGSADFSKRLVTGLPRNGRRNKDGRVWRCEECDLCIDRRARPEAECKKCDGTGLVPVEVIPTPDEMRYFQLCGVAWVEPEKR